MSDTNKHKRSPLKRKPLRNPGESLQEEIQRVLDSRQLPLIVIAACAIGFAVNEWWRQFFSTQPQPLAATLIAVVVVSYCSYRLLRLRKRVASLHLGLEGEKTIGQFLEANRADGWRVFHDIPCHGFNIDHVLIAPQGVFAIETKTFSRPARGKPSVKYDGERILVDGFEPDRNPIAQARAVRNWLRESLHEYTGMDYPVRGVVLLPGRYVDAPKGQRRTDIWVLNPKAFPKFVECQPVVLKNEDVAKAGDRVINLVAR
jgi:hypothetical protein